MWESISLYLLIAQAEPIAQESPAAKVIAEEVSSSPVLTEKSLSDNIVAVAKKESVVYRDNIEQYKDRLIAPIVSWVESDLFRFKVYESDVPKVANPDSNQPTLDRVISSQNFARNVLYDADFAWLAGEGLLRKAKLAFFRSFASSSSEEIVYEEVLRFTEPAVVNSYATQTFRFTNDDDDQISQYSPVVGAVRPIQSANRSDVIIDGEISLDDLFLFSANPKSFNSKIVDRKVLLVPFASDQPQALEKASALYSYKNNALEKFDSSNSQTYASLIGKQSSLEQRSLVLWNYEVKAFSSHASWLPLTVVFEPREVVVIELTPKDPFYAFGRQYLFVDAITAAPYYKLIYSHGGRFLRTVVGGWHKVSVPKEFAEELKCESDCLVPVFVLAVDREARNASVLSVNNAQFYSKTEPDLRFIFNDQQTVSEKSSQEKEEVEQPAVDEAQKPLHDAEGVVKEPETKTPDSLEPALPKDNSATENQELDSKDTADKAVEDIDE